MNAMPTRRFPVLLLLTLSVVFASPERGLAHGVGWQSESVFSVAICFMYDDGEPMAYGSVKVFSPANDSVQHQGGRSDRNGVFSFCPDAPGIWKFSGDDGQGHVARGEIAVTEADLAGGAAPRAVVQGGAQKPNMFQIFLGLSILGNIALAAMWFQAWKRSAPASAGTGGGD